MEAKHTPGPWKLNADEDTGMNDSGCILDSVGHVIVTDIYGTFKNGRTTGEAEANARLIAAAPDLLAQLQRTLIDLEDFCSDEPEFEWSQDAGNKMIREIEQAIAKARGGE